MSAVAEKIAREIGSGGSIPFARFMELALYCPVYGYYEAEGDRIGRGGDYYTSVSVGELFGALLGWQFAEWLGTGEAGSLRAGRTVRILEAGAHDGTLARDLLRWMRGARPGLFERMEYWIVEPSERRRAWQRRTLAEETKRVRWVKGLEELEESRSPALSPDAGAGGPLAPCNDVLFCNELLDAFPVHRLGWDARLGKWFEWGVGLEEESFVWTRRPWDWEDSRIRESWWARHVRDLPAELLPHLPDGYVLDMSPAAEEWWRRATRVVGSGKLVALDYGVTEKDWLLPERPQGTLRAYSGHRVTADVLGAPGKQDITAHVNFSAIRAAGEAAGLRTEAFVDQEQFLTRIAAEVIKQPGGFGSWTPAWTRQFQTLTHPQHLGRAFRVLVQGRAPEPPTAR